MTGERKPRSRFTNMTRIASAAVSHFVIFTAIFISLLFTTGANTANAGPAIAAPAEGPIYALIVDPAALNINAPTSVRVSVHIATPSQDLSDFILERLEAKATPQSLGEMKDDGLNGDLHAGDRIYSTSFQLNEKQVGFVNLRASAKISGKTELSPVFELAVLPKGAPVDAVGGSDLSNFGRDPKTGAKFVGNEVHVCFGRTVSYEKVVSVAKSVSGSVFGRFSAIGNCYQFKIPTSKDGLAVFAAIKKIKQVRGVLSAEPNAIYSAD